MIWIIPILLFIWAHTAGGFIIVPILFLAIYLLWNTAIPSLRHHMHISPKTLLSIAGMSFVGIVCTPIWLRIFLYPLTLYALVSSMRNVASLPGALLTLNQSFLKSAPSSEFYAGFLIYVILFLTLVGSYILRYYRKLSAAYLFLLPTVLLIGAGLAWVRFIPFSVFATLPLFTLTISSSIWPIRVKQWVIGIIGAFVGLSGLYILLSTPSTVAFVPPLKHMELIKEYNLPSHIFSTFDMSGYILYSLSNKTAILDAQDDTFDETSLVNVYSWPMSTTQEFIDDLTAKNLINTMIVNKNIGGLVPTLLSHPAWALIYFDATGFLFVKKSAGPESFLKSHELHSLDLTRNLGFNPDDLSNATQELEKFVSVYPFNSLARGQLATMYRLAGRFQEAKQVLLAIPTSTWRFPEYTEMGRIEAAQGLCVSAEKNFLSALRDRTERDYSRTVLDIAVLYAGCLGDMDRAKHYFLRYNSYQITPPEREKLRTLMETFHISLE
jgi:hypothetical protein